MRQSVKWFAKQMEKNLKENDHKSGWQGMDVSELWSMLNEEMSELSYEIHDDKPTAEFIISECADVANFAMMIADVTNMGIKTEDNK